MTGSDLPKLTGGDSEFDDWGAPAGPRASVARADLRQAGGLTIALSDTDEAVGSVTWHWVRWGPNPESMNPMIGIWLTKSARGCGIGTLAQRQILDLMFRNTPTNRVEAHTDITNVAEQRALERAGFTQEGTVRGAQWRRGAYHDCYLYSVLRSEWRAARKLRAVYDQEEPEVPRL